MIVKKLISSSHPVKCMFFVSLLLITVIPPVSKGGIDDLPIGARSLGMGLTYVAMANTADAIFLNPGGLSQIEGIELSVFYQKPFGLDDVNFSSAAVSFPMWHYRGTIGVLHLGNGIFTKQVINMAFSHHYKNKFYYGLSLRYNSIQITHYGSDFTLGMAVGFVFSINPRLNFGFFTENINRPHIAETSESLPQIIKTGISILPADGLRVNFEIYKDIRFTEEIRFGTEYFPIKNLAIRLGTTSAPDRFTAGVGIVIKAITFDYAFFTHNDLGLTHQMSLSLHFGKTVNAKPGTNLDTGINQIINDPNSDLININTATLKELTSLPGIGGKTATDIINYRENHGFFKTKNDLLLIKGMGLKTLKNIENLITVE